MERDGGYKMNRDQATPKKSHQNTWKKYHEYVKSLQGKPASLILKYGILNIMNKAIEDFNRKKGLIPKEWIFNFDYFQPKYQNAQMYRETKDETNYERVYREVKEKCEEHYPKY